MSFLTINKFNYSVYTVLIGVIIAILLLMSFVGGLPYGYFQFLRWVVMLASIYFLYISYKADIRWITFTAIIIAVLFNPIASIHMERETWLIFDSISAVFILLFAFNLRKYDTSN